MIAFTEQVSPTLDRLALEIEILKQTGALATQVGRLFVNQWLMARVLRRESRIFRAQIATLIQNAGSAELDPDDGFTDVLLTLQQTINRMIRLRDKQLRSPLSLGARWMLRGSQRLLIASHADLGWIRIAIMEHDADVSPIMGEKFTSANDLIAALHRDVAA
ncbi:MAG TPA: hypothetical protein DCS21_07365 [Gammaproteobacteria bacterium]|nr:hypothetical protein [Gammaproteobacteria bacterium]